MEQWQCMLATTSNNIVTRLQSTTELKLEEEPIALVLILDALFLDLHHCLVRRAVDVSAQQVQNIHADARSVLRMIITSMLNRRHVELSNDLMCRRSHCSGRGG